MDDTTATKSAFQQLREALLAVEWVRFPQELEPGVWVHPSRCMACKKFRGSGHAEDCVVWNALKASAAQ